MIFLRSPEDLSLSDSVHIPPAPSSQDDFTCVSSLAIMISAHSLLINLTDALPSMRLSFFQPRVHNGGSF